jgi:ribosomal protein L37E
MKAITFDNAKPTQVLSDVKCPRCGKMALEIRGTEGKKRERKHIECQGCFFDKVVGKAEEITYAKGDI